MLRFAAWASHDEPAFWLHFYLEDYTVEVIDRRTGRVCFRRAPVERELSVSSIPQLGTKVVPLDNRLGPKDLRCGDW